VFVFGDLCEIMKSAEKEKKILYVFYPALSMSTFRVIFILCCGGLILCALLVPQAKSDDFGFVDLACDLGNDVAMVRMLNWKHGCYVSVSYGGAVAGGFVAAILYCFTKFPQPLPLELVIPAGRWKKLSTALLFAFMIAGTWTIASAPMSFWKWSWISSNRVTVAMFAPMLFLLHMAIWGWLCFALTLKIRKIWNSSQKNNNRSKK
jgi:hypothetical protein